MWGCGAGWDAITVKDDIAFVPISFGPVQDATLYAIDASSGSIIWQNCYSQGFNASSAVWVEGDIYVSWPSGIVRALHSLTGNVLWESQISTVAGMMETPAYHDSRLYVGAGGYELFCLDALTGQDCWSTTGYCVLSLAIADSVLFFCESYNLGDTVSIFALDSQSGSEIWSFQTNSNYGSSTPAITDGILYTTSGDGYLRAFGSGLKYTYRDDLYTEVGLNELIVTSFDGGAVAADTINFTVTGTGIDLGPSRFCGLSATPNPFVSTTSISFELSQPGFTSVEIFDLSGRLVTTLVDSEQLHGNHSVQWNGCNMNGEEASAGLYLCRIESSGVIETTGLCLLK
ncbi:MAG: PQQ-binding-like beta-propeller repeat protein [Candidatus Sabulitectum sp.]|nr:PQQ-binding-like beta-propeller repeat protein [Candidatus Sabulitectum sp.]